MAHASTQLDTNLFLFNPPLRHALLVVRQLSTSLSTTGMLSLPPGETFNLDDFIRAQANVQDELRIKLDELSVTVLSSVRTACDEVVDQFLKANNIAANHKMTFMERAALRAECRRLTRFLRMVDIMMTDFLKSMVLEAMHALVAAVESTSLEPRIEIADDATDKTLARKRVASGAKSPLFRLVVHFKEHLSGEEGEETMSLHPNLEQLGRALDGIINESLRVVSSFVKVFSASETEMYVMPEGDEDETAGGEAAEETDLASTIRSNSVFSSCKDTIQRQLRYAMGAVRNYMDVFEPYHKIFYNNQKYASDVSVVFESGEVEAFMEAIAAYKAQMDEFKEMPCFADVGMMLVDSREMKSQMMPSPLSCIKAIREYLPQLAQRCAQALVDQVGSMNPVIAGEPNTVEAFVNKKKTKDLANVEMETYKSRQNYVRSLVHIMDDNQWGVPDDVKALMRMLKESVAALETNIQLADGKEEEETKKFSSQVRK